MSRSNKSSILVLATLGVYLGLLMTGATPQILASAAMTREFNVVDEIEVKDDLDKKPLNEEPDLGFYIESVGGLINELSRLKDRTFDWNKTGVFRLESLSFNKIDGSPSYLGTGSFNRRVDALLSESLEGIALSLFRERAKLENGDVHSFVGDIVFSLADGKLTLSTKIIVNDERNESRTSFASHLETSLGSLRSSVSPPKRLIADSTTLSIENDQVTVITRLPRAGLDSLLASSAK